MSNTVVQNYPRAFVLMLASTVSFSSMSALIKHYDSYPLSQALFIRGSVALLAVALVMLVKRQLSQIKTSRLKAHVVRGTFGLLAMTCTFYALRVIPIAEASAFFRAKPVFMVPMAYLILGEKFNSSRTIFTIVGFLGVIVMLNPATPQINFGTAAGLFAAIFGACAMITVRNLGSSEPTQTIVFYFMLISAVFTAPFAILDWTVVQSFNDWFGLSMIGLTGLIGQYLMVAAYRTAEASFVGPLDYFTLIWSSLLGLIIWHEVPGSWVIGGALIVLASQLASRHCSSTSIKLK